LILEQNKQGKFDYMLRIADKLKLPADAVTETVFACGVRGSGKSHTGSVIAEEMLKSGQPIVVYDPTGAWWGLKSSADGKKPAFPIYVFGGEHADVPLDESAGESVANLIVEKRLSAILDVSLLRKNARTRFMVGFCETLYHRNRKPLHFFVDEAHTIAPQKLIKQSPQQSILLGAVEDIVLQGRKRGLGCTIISQRPALVNKNVSTQCGTLIAMRLVSALDIKVIREWVEVHADISEAKEMIDSLPSMQRGDGWVWSPAWLEYFGRVHFRQRETFDSSATPKAGARKVKSPKLAQVDLNWLKGEMATAVEVAKANDPKELKRQIEELKKQLGTAKAKGDTKAPVPPPAGKIKIKRVEISVLKPADANKLLSAVVKTEAVGTKLVATAQTLLKAINAIDAQQAAYKRESAELENSRLEKLGHGAAKGPAKPERTVRPKIGRSEKASPSDLPKGELAVLTAVAQSAGKTTREFVTLSTGYKRSTRDTYLQRLREKNLIIDGPQITATLEGIAKLGDDYEPLPTGSDLLQWWLNRLPSGENIILYALSKVYPDGIDREGLSEQTSYKRSTRDTYIQRLSVRRLIKIVGGKVKAAEELFD
jgi:uncharacterized protein